MHSLKRTESNRLVLGRDITATVGSLKPRAYGKLLTQGKISVPESFYLLDHGFTDFQTKPEPTKTRLCELRRVAGNIFEAEDHVARREIRKMLTNVKDEGIFLILGHGGSIPCGAVSAKKKLLTDGIDVHENISHILDHIPVGILGLNSPEAEELNARHQATLLLDDSEFSAIINDKHISVVTGICTDTGINFNVIRESKSDGILNPGSVLVALSDQLKRGLSTALEEGKNLQKHFAHVMFIWDPQEMAHVMNPKSEPLELVGLCCIDGRLPPRVPGPRYIFRTRAGEAVSVTCSINGKVEFTKGELGSGLYGLNQVYGLAPGRDGNGHVLAFASSMEHARMIREAVLEMPEFVSLTKGGATISVGFFDGELLVLRNGVSGITIRRPYIPDTPIL